LSPEISVLLQIQHTPPFSVEGLYFLFIPVHFTPGDNIYYAVWYGVETVAVRVVCVDSLQARGPRSNLGLANFMWTTFSYCCANYVMVVLPLHTYGDKILYVHQYKADIWGEDSRTCRRCVWDFEDPRMFYGFGCLKPNRCTCTLQPFSLKTAASKIVFTLYGIHKFCFHQNTTYEQHVYAVQSGVNLPIQQPVPFTQFPYTPTIHVIQFDDFSLGYFHEHCSLAVNVQSYGNRINTLQRRFDTHAEFVNLVLHCNTKFWCTLCGKSLFSLSANSVSEVHYLSVSWAFLIGLRSVHGCFLSAQRHIIKRKCSL
jgi:hypothetical protein